MSTKSFIITLPIITGSEERRWLRKSFSFGCNLQNAVMGGGWDRVQPNPPGTLASVRRGGMAEKTAKCEAYVKRGSLI